jgi:D-3-phosphoglycerate dehydrogenase
MSLDKARRLIQRGFLQTLRRSSYPNKLCKKGRSHDILYQKGSGNSKELAKQTKNIFLDIALSMCPAQQIEFFVKELGIKHTPFDEILRKSDIVTIHVPVTDETRGMFNIKKFSLMKKSAVIINTARGPIVKTQDLVMALKEGMIAGTALDVFEEEPPPKNLKLLKMDNVILSPHIAWYSEEGGWDIRVMVMDDVRAFLKGKPPRFVVNPEVLRNRNLRFKRKR